MKDKAEAAQRMEQEMAGQKAAMEAAARAQREKLAGDFEARVSAIVGTVAGAADTPTKNAEVMSGEIRRVSERAQSSAEAAQQATHNTQAVAAAAQQPAARARAIRRQHTGSTAGGARGCQYG